LEQREGKVCDSSLTSSVEEEEVLLRDWGSDEMRTKRWEKRDVRFVKEARSESGLATLTGSMDGGETSK